ncbi:glycoside hydrolase/deacetylase [Neocallimastix lanati (nom. inval.)]|jgi:peptidoglycan/xylan/chitin deacetylase (PgdA/CDA1 family)|uniref:Glycoside hydrolase/deacetylase n=1 Tax=Neocallimastix californiae TaxID=1754190 RepID=A0A1Y1ZFL8_9FUNG|nr:glycoside hydrolase/deacetylase [Neocallimastix sp. JGI-2020a]ORY08757.1 glycoside hydrolase/deacetylase [Neocallimastix californiae]|eukprot:ORY08757.1 glycoside hydrolase/deacetylase [Neocallimastix californiae]
MKSFFKLSLISLIATQCLSQFADTTATDNIVTNDNVNTGSISNTGTIGNTGATDNTEAAGNTGVTGETNPSQGTSATTGTGNVAAVYTECKKPGQFVLTFDDGPQIGTTARCLDVLKKNGIIGTFFINSANYVDLPNNPEAQALVKRAYEEGHDIGSHTYQHKDLFLAIQENSLEINVDKNNEMINSIIGRQPVFFRPPLGNGGFTKEYCAKMGIPYDPQTEVVREYLGERGMKVIMWNADTQDWNNKGNVDNSIAELGKSVNPKNPQTSSFITLIHDVHEYSVDVILQRVIDYVRDKGYQFVSLAECIGEAPYIDGYNPNQPKPGTTNNNIMKPQNTQSLGNEPLDLESSSIKSIAYSIIIIASITIINAFLY